MDPSYIIRDEAALLALYGGGNAASMAKEIDHIHPHYRAFIEASSFVILASVGPDGLDASPRGDHAGFVAVADERTLLIPDRRGNNRVDTLHNLVIDPRIGLLFLIPGVGESLRVNGKATISVDPALLARFAIGDKPARSVIVIAVETVYYQCPRAAVRADLWNPEKFVARAALPSSGTILADLSANALGGSEWDRTRDETVRATLY
jgi:PPOX class probable FMN-dependent enzyme